MTFVTRAEFHQANRRGRLARARRAVRQRDVLREEVERLLRAHMALDLGHRAACRELKLCRDALRRERQARWSIRPFHDPPP